MQFIDQPPKQSKPAPAPSGQPVAPPKSSGLLANLTAKNVLIALVVLGLGYFGWKEFGGKLPSPTPINDSVATSAQGYIRSSPNAFRAVARDILGGKVKDNNEAVAAVAAIRKSATDNWVKEFDAARNAIIDKGSPTGEFKDPKEAAALFNRAADAMEASFK